MFLKVGTHVETSPCNKFPEEFTRRYWSQGLLPRTVHTKHSEEQVAGTCPKISNWFEFVELVAGTKVSTEQKWPTHTMGLAAASCCRD